MQTFIVNNGYYSVFLCTSREAGIHSIDIANHKRDSLSVLLPLSC